MNKITFPRIGEDGVKRDEKEIENWFVGQVENSISDALDALENNALNSSERLYIAGLKSGLHSILVAKPKDLVQFTSLYSPITGLMGGKKIRKAHPSPRDTEQTLKADLLKAFNYGGFRSNVLVELAKKLNIKTCPYCNMSYTLYAQTTRTDALGISYNDGIARFQFDHFFSKSKYPWLSMSLYNLIPSCPLCNQVKSTGNLSLSFHPYHSSIGDLFHFEVARPLPLLFGAIGTPDRLSVQLIKNPGLEDEELESFDEQFHLKDLYSRHGDIAEEVFEKAYLYPYYSERTNFKFLPPEASIEFDRLWFGTYTEGDMLEKRPMSKFIQDIWKQAKGDY